MHNSCLGISPKYLIFQNAPKPIIDLYGISFLCTNFETFTIFRAIVLIDCTYPPYYKTKRYSRKLVTGNEVNEITEPKHIRSELKSFYSNLYKRQSMKTEAECLEYLDSINLPCLTASDTQSCEGRLIVKECWDALRSIIKNN